MKTVRMRMPGEKPEADEPDGEPGHAPTLGSTFPLGANQPQGQGPLPPLTPHGAPPLGGTLPIGPNQPHLQRPSIPAYPGGPLPPLRPPGSLPPLNPSAPPGAQGPGPLPPLPTGGPLPPLGNVDPRSMPPQYGQAPLPPLVPRGHSLPPLQPGSQAPAPLPPLTNVPSMNAPPRGAWRPTMKTAARPHLAHPLAEPLYWACVDLFTLASQFGLGSVPPSVHELRRHLAELFANMDARARAAGVSPEDVRESQFAIMALFDEILVQMPWPGQHEWRAHPLQLIHFQNNAAGETFFDALQPLMNQPHRAHVLSIYFFCLALGFQGRHALGGAQRLDAIYDAVGVAVENVVPPSELISPHADPADGGRHFLQQEAPIFRLSLLFFGVALVFFIVLRIVLSTQVSRAKQPMDDYARAAGVVAP